MYVEANNARFWVETAGEGDPVVFIHFGLGGWRIFEPEFHALADQFRCVAFDRRFVGRTEAPPEPYSSVADVVALLDALGIGTAALVGLSGGGKLALDVAFAHPERVRALVQIAAPVTGVPWGEELGELYSGADTPEQKLAADFRVWAPLGVDNLMRELRQEVRDDPEAAVEAKTPPVALEEVRVPTLVIVAKHDPSSLQNAGREAARRIPNGRLVEIDSDHYLTLREAELVSGLLLEFLTSSPSLGVSSPDADGRRQRRKALVRRGRERGAVLLLHGGLGDSGLWEPVVPFLAERFRTIRTDLRFFGSSTGPAMPWSWQNDVIGVLDELGIERAALVGLSLGGKIALDVALAHPERLWAVAGVAPALGGHDGAAYTAEHEARYEAAEHKLEAMLEIDLEVWAPLGADERIRQLWRATPDANPLPGRRRASRPARRSREGAAERAGCAGADRDGLTRSGRLPRDRPARGARGAGRAARRARLRPLRDATRARAPGRGAARVSFRGGATGLRLRRQHREPAPTAAPTQAHGNPAPALGRETCQLPTATFSQGRPLRQCTASVRSPLPSPRTML